MVCSFATNEQMNKGTMELTDNLRANVKDVDTYLASTNMQINTLLDTNYREFQSSLFNTLDSKRAGCGGGVAFK